MSNQLRIGENPDSRVWDDFVCARDGHLLQTSAWGELKSRFGWSARRIAIECGGEIIAGAQILFRRLLPGLTFAYVPRGPVADVNDRETLSALFEAMSAAPKSRGAFMLKIEPNNPSLTLPHIKGEGRVGACIQPHSTIHLDLTRDLDMILAQMKNKWRYNIRLAERKGVQVRAGNEADLPRFYDLLKITSARDQFAIHSSDYFRAAFELLVARNYAHLFVAQFEGEPLAMIFVTAVGREAIYLYGASGNMHRERMPNHALHWAAIRWAKARGCTRYDLWGVGATAEATVGAVGAIHKSPLPESPQHGLYQFKQGFGGEVVRYAGAYDVIFSRVKFEFYQRALAFRKSAMG